MGLRVFVAFKGGFGDVLPLMAVAVALKERGHEATIAGEAHHQVLARDAGLPFQVLPGPRGTPFGSVQVEEVQAICSLLAPVDLLLANPLAPGAVLAARYLKKPWVYASATPLAFASLDDPPWWPGLVPWQRLLAASPSAQALAFRLARQRAAWESRHLVRAARALGISLAGHPRFEGLFSPAGNLLLASPLFSPKLPRRSWNIQCTGFCAYTPPSLANNEAEALLEDFLRDGDPPVVIAPGGADRLNPRPFVDLALAAARKLGLRVVVSAREGSLRKTNYGPEVLILPYLPYSTLFRGARLAIHSAGIGSLSWVLRAGIPSILLPSVWDQFDNARRAVERGYGLWPRRRARELSDAIQKALSLDHKRLRADADQLSREHGATTAVDFLERNFSA